jgi:hypothetical protein
VASRGISHDVVHGRPESLEQERVTVEVLAQQSRAANTVAEAQHGRLEAEFIPPGRHTDLENGRRPVGERRFDNKRHMATAQRRTDRQRPVPRQRLHHHRQLVEPRRIPIGNDLVPYLVGDVELHTVVVSHPTRRRC